MGMFDRRKAPWLPGGCRVRAFERMQELAKAGRTQRQIAAELGATMHALNSYMWRQGITMAELKGEEDGGS